MTDRIMDSTRDAFVMLGAAAAVTSRVRIGTSVLLGALRKPLLAAKALASVDDISNGRLIVGLGAGSRAEDFAASDVQVAQRGKRTEELVDLLRLAWSGQPIRYRGRYAQYDLGPMGLLPPQGKAVPIWFGGKADAVLRRVARTGDGFIGSTSSGVEGFRANWTSIQNYAREAGRDPATITPAALIHFSLDSDRERAREAMRTYLSRSYGAGRVNVGLGNMVGAPADLIKGAHEYFDAGVQLLILTSITADPNHLERLITDVLPNLPLDPPQVSAACTPR
jgi:probable F420-dependent oxidoreductase